MEGRCREVGRHTRLQLHPFYRVADLDLVTVDGSAKRDVVGTGGHIGRVEVLDGAGFGNVKPQRTVFRMVIGIDDAQERRCQGFVETALDVGEKPWRHIAFAPQIQGVGIDERRVDAEFDLRDGGGVVGYELRPVVHIYHGPVRSVSKLVGLRFFRPICRHIANGRRAIGGYGR